MVYTVYGTTQTKSITRMAFADPPVVRVESPEQAFASHQFPGFVVGGATGAESGWGIGLTHQGNVIFATWFTYRSDGKPMWLIAVASQTGPSTYAGPLSSVTGPPFYPEPFVSSKVVETIIGNASFDFADGNHATFTYGIDGETQTKSLTRQIFAPPGTVCH
jgi:hypothetical protein